MCRKIGVLYCGGCNPHFDRVALVEGIQKQSAGKAHFEKLKPDETYDVALVVCGCNTACANMDGINAGKIVLIRLEEALKANFEPDRILNLLFE
jgi:hypothetical protein